MCHQSKNEKSVKTAFKSFIAFEGCPQTLLFQLTQFALCWYLDSLVSLCSDESDKQILQVTSPSTGTAIVNVPFLNGLGKLSLTSGSYPFHVTSEQANCTVDIKVKGKC